MFLKSLTLKGFKSFADSTTMELEPGVTVVVGPNGSGKSNVVDAIAWVLGAQAPKAVRNDELGGLLAVREDVADVRRRCDRTANHLNSQNRGHYRRHG